MKLLLREYSNSNIEILNNSFSIISLIGLNILSESYWTEDFTNLGFLGIVFVHEFLPYKKRLQNIFLLQNILYNLQ